MILEQEGVQGVTKEQEIGSSADRNRSLAGIEKIQAYNTMTRSLEPIRPKESGRIQMFVCGPTVYDYSHLGHAKTYTQFDFIARYLRWRGYDVVYLQNITDIDDKIIERARMRGESPEQLAARYESEYRKDMASLQNTGVTIYARATEFIDQIVNQVQRLLRKGYAYRTSDGYYFDLARFQGYGKLSGRTELRPDDAVSRIDENQEKRNPRDFCLWKAQRAGDPCWNTDLGPGRPGWHIEDTAITEHFFGPQYDIHGGAVDLVFPHHEAEIAQIEAATGMTPMVRHWLHTGFLNMKNEKMSKSTGNLVTIRDVLKKVDYRVLRYLLLSHHYRSAIEFSEEGLEAARNSVQRMNNFLRSIWKGYDDPELEEGVRRFRTGFYGCLDKDFDTPRALALLFGFIRDQNRAGAPSMRVYGLMREIDTLLGCLEFEDRSRDSRIDELVQLRQRLRVERRFDEADQIRRRLDLEGILVEDTIEGVRWRYQ